MQSTYCYETVYQIWLPRDVSNLLEDDDNILKIYNLKDRKI